MLISVAKIPRSTYNYQVKRLNKADKDKDLKEDILRIFRDENYCRYGYRRITNELQKTKTINHKKVQRLMREMGLFCMVRAKRYSSFKGDFSKAAPNLLNRNFKAEKPNEKWVTDLTEFNLFGQKLYLSPIMDLYNSEIVSYAISSRPKLNMVLNMLDEAISKLPSNSSGLILHSDQGWHYRMRNYQQKLKANGIKQSMSRKGNCLDNASMENFFGVLKTELLYISEFDSMEHFISELHKYIHYYNNLRIKSKFKMSPVQFKNMSVFAA